MNKILIKKIKTFVEGELKKPDSHYGYEPFPYHLIPTVNYAKELSSRLGGDKEVIIISAWLHDIGSANHGRVDHHISGAKIAEKKLKELKYPKDKINLVKKCILNHRGSQNNTRKSIEEKIVAEADTMSNFDNIAGIFKAAFVFENKDQGEAKRSALQKLKRKYKQLHFKESKMLIKPKYEAVKILLK